jgi:2-(3-amino-3-carboxypropyl)histidine synthase
MFEEKFMSSLLEKIRRHNGKRVLLQVPEGLKTSVQALLDFLGKNDVDVLLSVDPCFGACDLRSREAEELGCDLIVHIGHSDFGVKSRVPVIYEHYEMPMKALHILGAHEDKLKGFKRIGVVTTIQFVHELDDAKYFLEKNGFEPVIGKSSHGIPGQILGCDHTAALSIEDQVDCFLYIGSGSFHPLGLQEKTGKPVMFIDVEKGNITSFLRERERLEIMRGMRIQKARDLQNFGIIVSTKPGQMKVGKAEAIKEKLKFIGKNVYILVADQITPEKLMGLKIDVLVNTACPRIREDASLFRKVVLNPEDVDLLEQ